MAKTHSKASIKSYIRYGLLGLLIVLTFTLTYIYILKKPSNDREWETSFKILPHISMQDNQIQVDNFRNFHLDSQKNLKQEYTSRTINPNDIQRVWLVVEPFTIEPFTDFKGVAHTYFVFDIANQKPVVVSVEARREQNEKYDAFAGMFNNFELTYVWGSEEDQTVRRVVKEDNELYMYPLTISQSSQQRLFLQLAETTQQLESNARFYNTFTSNCTNELAKNANLVKPNAIPLSKAYFMPGYTAQELYKLGFIPNDNISLEELNKKYAISDKVQKHNQKENLSELLRQELGVL